MKTTLVILLMLFSSSLFAQLSLSSSLGFGAKINSRLDYSLFQTEATVNVNYQIEKITISSKTLSAISDSTTDFFSGLQLAYDIWSKDKKTISLGAEALIGMAGKKLFGGDLKYRNEEFNLEFSVAQEYLNKELWLNLSVGVPIIK